MLAEAETGSTIEQVRYYIPTETDTLRTIISRYLTPEEQAVFDTSDQYPSFSGNENLADNVSQFFWINGLAIEPITGERSIPRRVKEALGIPRSVPDETISYGKSSFTHTGFITTLYPIEHTNENGDQIKVYNGLMIIQPYHVSDTDEITFDSEQIAIQYTPHTLPSGQMAYYEFTQIPQGILDYEHATPPIQVTHVKDQTKK